VLSGNLFQESRLAYICELDLDVCERSHEKLYDDLKNEYSRYVDAASCVGEQNSEIVVLLPIHILSESEEKKGAFQHGADHSALHDDLASEHCLCHSFVRCGGAESSASIQSYQEEVHAIWHGKSQQCFA